MVPLIDRVTGAVRLGDDLILTSGVSADRLANYITPAERAQIDKARWLTPFPVGTVYGVLDIALFFKKGTLRSVKANLKSEYGPQQAMIKGRHDGFLTELLGRPTSERAVVRSIADKLFTKALGQDWPKLTKELTWKLRWGEVISTVDLRDGISQFRIDWN